MMKMKLKLKLKLKLKFLLLSLILSTPALALGEDICFTDIGNALTSQGLEMRNLHDMQWEHPASIPYSALQCRKRDEFVSWFENYSIFLAGMSIICMVPPDPLTKGAVVVFGVSSGVASIISFVSKKLPCTGNQLSVSQEEEVERSVCRMMKKKWVKVTNGENKCI